mgnify:CR=1 FL=1
MFLLAALGEFRVGDMIFQLIFFLILVALVVAVVTFIVKNSRNKRLDRIEEKIDKLLSDKDK